MDLKTVSLYTCTFIVWTYGPCVINFFYFIALMTVFLKIYIYCLDLLSYFVLFIIWIWLYGPIDHILNYLLFNIYDTFPVQLHIYCIDLRSTFLHLSTVCFLTYCNSFVIQSKSLSLSLSLSLCHTLSVRSRLRACVCVTLKCVKHDYISVHLQVEAEYMLQICAEVNGKDIGSVCNYLIVCEGPIIDKVLEEVKRLRQRKYSSGVSNSRATKAQISLYFSRSPIRVSSAAYIIVRNLLLCLPWKKSRNWNWLAHHSNLFIHPFLMYNVIYWGWDWLTEMRFYGPINPLGSYRVGRSVYLTTLFLGRFSPLSG